MSDKQIEEWGHKLKESFGDESKMYEYLFQTMDNFYYRYIETTIDKNLKTKNLGNHIWGAESKEISMVDALKITNPQVKKLLIDMAKTVPRDQKPFVDYRLISDVKELKPDKGELKIISEISWNHPEYKGEQKSFKKQIDFKYTDLTQFRKQLALKLEEACEIFL